MTEKKGAHWSIEEVSAVVADYLRMLRLYLGGQPFSKAEHRRRLQQSLQRSDSSIEFKHQNISAVLRDLGRQWLAGYPPRENYQRLLAEEVVRQIAADPTIDRAAQHDAERPAAVPSDQNFRTLKEEPPRLRKEVREHQPPTFLPKALKRDYLALEARNLFLGRAGEEFVLQYEEWRLNQLKRPHLASRIEYVASKDDGAGFDILSFEDDGRERFIEVKTTSYAKETPFFLSRSELEFSKANEARYRLYRLFEFRSGPRLFELSGRVDNHCLLDPVSYRARFS